jgi:hypothetical protein
MGAEVTTAARALEQELGAPVPEGVRRLDPADVQHLANAVAQARRRQAQAIATAGERALRFVPRLLRGPLRKAVG